MRASTLRLEVRDAAGEVVATVRKQVHVRRKPGPPVANSAA